MNAFIYLVNRFFFRFVDFWRDWYVGSFKTATDAYLSLLEKLDRKVALRVTFKNFFQPLYQDRSIIGYLLGFIFRGMRLIFGAFFYFFISLVALAIYLLWLAIPVFIVFEIIKASIFKF